MICPHCSVAVKLNFYWRELIFHPVSEIPDLGYEVKVDTCPNCNDLIVIVVLGIMDKKRDYVEQVTKEQVVYPISSTAPMPITDMPEEIKDDYMEARAVVDLSPRAAAALLRLAVQKLMPLLGAKGKNINDDIAYLVSKGLSVEIQQALDVLRVIGNESVHPGEINLNDDRETAIALFELLNLIVERMITQPKKIEALYDKLPTSKKKGISQRDSKQ